MHSGRLEFFKAPLSHGFGRFGPGAEAFEQIDDRLVALCGRDGQGRSAVGVRGVQIRAEVDQALGQPPSPVADGDVQGRGARLVLGIEIGAALGQERQGVPIVYAGPDEGEQESLRIVRRAGRE